MHKITLGSALATVAVTGLALCALPGTAQAAPVPVGQQAASTVRPAARDGYLYAWRDANESGPYCEWSGSDGNWNTCSPAGNLDNAASSILNNGYDNAYPDVMVYQYSDYNKWTSGGFACISNGVEYDHLGSYVFPNNDVEIGDHISSHQWMGAGC